MLRQTHLRLSKCVLIATLMFHSPTRTHLRSLSISASPCGTARAILKDFRVCVVAKGVLDTRLALLTETRGPSAGWLHNFEFPHHERRIVVERVRVRFSVTRIMVPGRGNNKSFPVSSQGYSSCHDVVGYFSLGSCPLLNIHLIIQG